MSISVCLPQFEGPLDLLLYLVQRQELNVFDVPLARVADQYVGYLEQHEDLAFGGEFLVVAATLTYLKSRYLLPSRELSAAGGEADGEEMEAELRRRLVVYQAYRDAGEELRVGLGQVAAFWPATALCGTVAKAEDLEINLNTFHLLEAAHRLWLSCRPEPQAVQMALEKVSVADMIKQIMSILGAKPRVWLSQLWERSSSVAERVATFVALLELVKRGRVKARQEELFADVELRRPGRRRGDDEAPEAQL
ncbi:MAG: segregation/condensation protein A [Candidatus Schekmanbacteria bacterium]|nr:segregation/condensation protein A [Candidatus Schekmanbacteria bacterium]